MLSRIAQVLKVKIYFSMVLEGRGVSVTCAEQGVNLHLVHKMVDCISKNSDRFERYVALFDRFSTLTESWVNPSFGFSNDLFSIVCFEPF